MVRVVGRGYRHHHAHREVDHRSRDGALSEFLVDPALDRATDLRLQVRQPGPFLRAGRAAVWLVDAHPTMPAVPRERIPWSIMCSLSPAPLLSQDDFLPVLPGRDAGFSCVRSLNLPLRDDASETEERRV